MRFRDAHLALLLRDFLLSKGIFCKLSAWNNEVRVVVRSHDFPVAEEIAVQFQKNPTDPMYREASWKGGTVFSGDVFAAAEKQYWRQIKELSGPVTLSVLLLILVIFLMTHWPGFPGFSFLLMPDQPAELWAHPYLLLTPALVHLTWSHLLFNALWWWEFARRIETLQGSGRLLMLSLVLAVVANLAQYFWAGPHFAGLSGVVMGLAAYLLAVWGGRKKTLQRLPPGLGVMIVVSLLLGASGVLDVVVGPIAQAAHVGGFLAGLIIGLALRWTGASQV